MESTALQAVQPILESTASLVNRGKKQGAPFKEDELVALRAGLRKKLRALKAELGACLTERESYLTLFPIVVYLDEIVQTTLIGAGQISWPLLQEEFFETERGGEMFYETLEDILDSPALDPFVHQIYYFCLSLGFKGKHVSNQNKISQYLRRLADKFEVPLPAQVPPEEQQTAEVGLLKLTGSYAWYYAAAAAVVALTFLLFHAVS